MSKASAAVANSRSSPGAKPRKNVGKASSIPPQQETGAVPDRIIAGPTGRPAKGEFVWLRVPRTSHTLKDKLHRLSCKINCLIGMQFLNMQETVIVYLLLMGLAALTAAGAYKQLSKLVGSLLEVEARAGAAAGQ